MVTININIMSIIAIMSKNNRDENIQDVFKKMHTYIYIYKL